MSNAMSTLDLTRGAYKSDVPEQAKSMTITNSSDEYRIAPVTNYSASSLMSQT